MGNQKYVFNIKKVELWSIRTATHEMQISGEWWFEFPLLK